MKRFLPKSVKNPKGFTLVELLVVISIIAILSVIGVTLYSGLQKNARDSKRRGDIDAIVKAWEVAYASNGTYPALSTTMFAEGVIPADPQGTVPYSYCTTNTAGTFACTTTAPTTGFYKSFVACAKLENNNGNASSTDGTPASGQAATLYCRKNQQ